MKKIIFISLLLIILSGGLAFVAQAQTATDTLSGLDQTAKEVSAFKGSTGTNFDKNFLQTKVGQIIGTVLAFIGVLFLLLMIYAGISWMLSEGNEQQVSKAKSLLINAIIGIIIVFSAYAITTFLGERLMP